MAENEIREVVEEVGQLEEAVVPPAPELPALAVTEIPVFRIFLFLVLFYLTAIIIRVFFISGPSIFTLLKYFAKPSTQLTVRPSLLFDFFLYMCLACTFFPIPTLPAIAFTAKIFSPFLVSFLGAAGTCVANLNDYTILGWLFRNQKVKKIRDIRSYRKLLYYFDKHSFLTLAIATFLPIPIDVIRLLAISRAYTYWKYVAATFVGRFPRYLIIAYLGRELPAKYIFIIFGITIIPAIYKFVSDMIKKSRKR